MTFDASLETIMNAASFAAGTVTSAHQHDAMDRWAGFLSITNEAPSTKNFADTDITTTGDYINISAHGYKVGLLGTLTTTGALPTGLANNVNYYVINNAAGSIKLATSRANALAGTAITLAKDGNGTHSFKATALGGLDVHWQGSLDGSTYVNLSGSTLAAATTGDLQNFSTLTYNYVRADSTLTSGQITVTAKVRSLGQR